MKTLFENRKLSRDQAVSIARSQKDLGGKSQNDMVIALSAGLKAKTFEEVIKYRMDAFKRLDPLSQFIVKEFLCKAQLMSRFQA